MRPSPAAKDEQSPGRLLLWLAAGIFTILQINLWFGEGGILDVHRLKFAVASQQAENLRLQQRNQVLQAEVDDLRNGSDAIEERARLDLGMTKDNETFYLITGKALAGSTTNNPQPATPAVTKATHVTSARSVPAASATSTQPKSSTDVSAPTVEPTNVNPPITKPTVSDTTAPSLDELR